MNYYAFHIGDFRSGTVNMSRQARWIYRDMLDVYYDAEQALPLDLDALCDEIGVEADDERRIVERLLRFKFVKGDDGYHQKRCDTEIARYQEGSEADRSRREHERERQARHRQRRAELFEALRASGTTPPFNTTTETLQEMLSSAKSQDVTRDVPVHAEDATAITKNQEPRTKNQEPTTKTKAAPSALPEWMPMDSWAGYLDMRKKQKKPPTERAIELLIGVLGKMRDAGHDIAVILDTSTKNCWIDVYLPKDRQTAMPAKTGVTFSQAGKDYSSNDKYVQATRRLLPTGQEANADLEF